MSTPCWIQPLTNEWVRIMKVWDPFHMKELPRMRINRDVVIKHLNTNQLSVGRWLVNVCGITQIFPDDISFSDIFLKKRSRNP